MSSTPRKWELERHYCVCVNRTAIKHSKVRFSIFDFWILSEYEVDLYITQVKSQIIYYRFVTISRILWMPMFIWVIQIENAKKMTKKNVKLEEVVWPLNKTMSAQKRTTLARRQLKKKHSAQNMSWWLPFSRFCVPFLSFLSLVSWLFFFCFLHPCAPFWTSRCVF